jgi:long-chain acyl-CoA synthetase
MPLREYKFIDVYRRNADLYPNRTAFIFANKRITHREYLKRIERLAAGLSSEGVRPGDRVAIISRNSLEMLDLIGAVARLGAILLPINFRLKAEEIGYALADGAPSLVFAEAEYQTIITELQAVLPSVRRYFGIGANPVPFSPYADLLASDALVPDVDFSADDGFVIIHTAAVGGRPRGALLSQANLLAAQSSLSQSWNLTERDINLAALPLFHVAGLGLALTIQQAGGCNVVLPKFDPRQAVRDISARKVTVMCEFAPMLANMMVHAKGEELETLRAVTGLDTAATIESFGETYPHAVFWSAFGQSETSGFVTFSPYRDRPGSAGQPMFWRNIAVVDSGDVPKPTGEVGEIVVQGPTVFKGYWNAGAETSHAFRNGWHHTGDMGYLDTDGYLWYAGRAHEKELIKTGGENVYPAEVEEAIRGHPDIDEVVVVGVPDPEWSEAIKAICVRRLDSNLAADELIEYISGLIAGYKKPKHVVFVDRLPKTDTGEVDRASIKSEHT